MALIKKPVPAVAARVAPKLPVKPATKPVVAKQDGFQVVDMSTIDLKPKSGGGGGKQLSPFAVKVFSLEHGQGFKISEERYGEKGKGIASIYAGAARRGHKLRVRRDTNNQLWIFRVTEEQENEALAAKEQRAQEAAEAAQAE
jgi:hypothetical protein